MDHLSAPLQIKTVSLSQRLICGLAACHHNVDRVRDIIDPSASAKATARLASPADVAVLVGHNSAMLPVGIPQKIEAQPAGLYTETYILKGAAGDNLLAVAKDLAEHGCALGMSIGYKTRQSRMERHSSASGTKSVRRLLDYDLKEFSYAAQQAIANPMALVSAIKSGQGHERSLETKMQYRVEQDGSEWVVYCDVDADGDEDDNQVIGTYQSQETANAVATALRMQARGDPSDADDDADENEVGPGKTTAPAALAMGSLKATWSTRAVNDLDDSSFLYVEPGEKDDDGKTVPRSKRHFPYKDAQGKVDIPHLRNAIARIPQSDLSDDLKARLQARARRLLAQAQGGDGKTAEDGPEWHSGAALALYGLGARLQDLAEQAAAEHKAMSALGEDTKDYCRLRAPLCSELRATLAAATRVAEHAEAIESGSDGNQRLAWLRRQLALTEV